MRAGNAPSVFPFPPPPLPNVWNSSGTLGNSCKLRPSCLSLLRRPQFMSLLLWLRPGSLEFWSSSSNWIESMDDYVRSQEVIIFSFIVVSLSCRDTMGRTVPGHIGASLWLLVGDNVILFNLPPSFLWLWLFSFFSWHPLSSCVSHKARGQWFFFCRKKKITVK